MRRSLLAVLILHSFWIAAPTQAQAPTAAATPTAAAATDKPDVEVEYNFYRKIDATDSKTGAVEQYFGSTSPQSFDARTLRPEFSLTAGDLIIAGQDMPMTRFPLGDYRLEVKVTDRTTGKSLSRDVDFTVAGS